MAQLDPWGSPDQLIDPYLAAMRPTVRIIDGALVFDKTFDAYVGELQAQQERKRRPPRCSACGEDGHNRLSCNLVKAGAERLRIAYELAIATIAESTLLYPPLVRIVRDYMGAIDASRFVLPAGVISRPFLHERTLLAYAMMRAVDLSYFSQSLGRALPGTDATQDQLPALHRKLMKYQADNVLEYYADVATGKSGDPTFVL